MSERKRNQGCGCHCGSAASETCASTIENSTVHFTTSAITWANRWDHFLARWGYRRNGHKVEPGLYTLGGSTPDSPVFVTANYTLSFDALRSALAGIDGYILTLNTYGINVWCAAGKGTFGTDELVRRIEATRLHDVVNHRVLILPQLGAPGIAAHEVKKRSGFKVEYGPVRAADLPEYLKTYQATPEMRRVRFPLWDRMVLVPVDLVGVFVPMLIAAVALFLIIGPLAAAGALAADTSVQQQGVHPGRVGGASLYPGGVTGQARCRAVAARRRGVGVPAGPVAGDCLPGAELYRCDDVHVPERRAARDVRLHSRDGLDVRGGHRPDNCPRTR
jgi:hypothetical protein